MTRIAYQGAPGAYSHLAARSLFPSAQALPMFDFAAVVRAVERGTADLGILPIENSVIGQVTEARAALAAASRLVVISESDYPIRHCLLALPGAEVAMLRSVESHPAALAQCARYLSARRLPPRPVADTAGAAQSIAIDRDFTRSAIAAEEAAELYGLAILARDIADAPDNRTRFVVVAPNGKQATAA